MSWFSPFRLDVANQCLWRGDTRVSLMPKPFAVLRYLVEHQGRLVTHDELLAAIWPDTYVQPEVLRRYILEIRRALGDPADAPRFIRTLPKRGYQFIAPVTEAPVGLMSADSAALSTRLVGREKALADLHRSLTTALTRQRQLVFVVGEPGIGKTSLVDEFQRECGSVADLSVVRGQSVEGFGGKEAYYPLLEAVGQLSRGPLGAFVADTLARIAPTWLVQFPAFIKDDQRGSLQREILGATRERMVRELCEALEVMTKTVSLVIILEDLHLVDHATLDVISLFARRREPARLLLIGTLRPADLILSESPLKALKQDLLLHRLSHEVELEPLRESDVASYLDSTFAPGDLPPDLATAIYRHSDGNPLFMVAMLDHLVNAGVLALVNGRWTMSRALNHGDPGVPETLRQMLEMQLQHASEEEQHLLKAASVAGLQFSVWAVWRMLAGDSLQLEALCDALVARQQFLRYIGTRDLPNGEPTAEYRFTHSLYREVLYRRLSPTQRSTFHKRLGSGLEELRSPVEPESAGQIALHFEEGHDFSRAIRYLLVAAENATRRYAHQQAIAILEHARHLLPKVPEEEGARLELLLLERIGNAHYARGDMGQSAAVYELMAVRAADRGLLPVQAEALMRLAHPAESAPFFLKAIELDPDFVAAYTGLSRIYSNISEGERAKEYAKRAYERRDRVGERERLSITYQYHYEVTGDQARAGETLEAWGQAFPLEFQPVNSLAVMHNFLGNFELAIAEGLEAVRRNPAHGYPYSNLAHAYRGAGRFGEAKRTAERALSLEIETLPTRRLLYELAFAEGDHDAAAKHAAWARDRPREFEMVSAQAQAGAWLGRVREARQLFEEAARLAEMRQLPDAASGCLARIMSVEWAYGYGHQARQLARRVLAGKAGYDPRLRAAAVLAATGSADEAEAIVTELVNASPDHTLINAVLAPVARAAIELACDRPARAVQKLRMVAPYELGFIAALAPLHLRGQSHLALGSGPAAAAEFQRILDHRGSDPFSPFHAVAHIGLARAHALAGDVARSRQAYKDFIDRWAQADNDIPILRAARSEYRRLGRTGRAT